MKDESLEGKTNSKTPLIGNRKLSSIHNAQNVDLPNVNTTKKPEERIADTNDGTMLTTSEIIDFSEAVDSSPTERELN